MQARSTQSCISSPARRVDGKGPDEGVARPGGIHRLDGHGTRMGTSTVVDVHGAGVTQRDDGLAHAHVAESPEGGERVVQGGDAHAGQLLGLAPVQDRDVEVGEELRRIRIEGRRVEDRDRARLGRLAGRRADRIEGDLQLADEDGRGGEEGRVQVPGLEPRIGAEVDGDLVLARLVHEHGGMPGLHVLGLRDMDLDIRVEQGLTQEGTGLVPTHAPHEGNRRPEAPRGDRLVRALAARGHRHVVGDRRLPGQRQRADTIHAVENEASHDYDLALPHRLLPLRVDARGKPTPGHIPRLDFLQPPPARYPPRPMNLLHRLHEFQTQHGWLPEDALRAFAAEVDVPLYRVQEVASFYPHFRLRPPPRMTISVCRDAACHLQGAGPFTWAIREFLATSPDVEVHEVSCLGRCEHAPAAAMNDVPVEGWTAEDVVAAVRGEKFLPVDEPTNRPRRWPSDPYDASDGHYGVLEGLLADRERARATIPDLIEAAGLRGMGGAGFPTGLKWRLVRDTPGAVKWAIVNADESEPGTFKDRVILEELPHLVVEGLLIGCLVSGATRAVVFIRHEYGREGKAIRREIARVEARGILSAHGRGARALRLAWGVHPGRGDGADRGPGRQARRAAQQAALPRASTAFTASRRS